MRNILFFLLLNFFAVVVVAQDHTLTENKIIEDGKEYYLYEVQESEGFMAIGRKFGVAYRDIIDINAEETKDGLKPGQILRIPVMAGRNMSKTEIKSDKYVYHKVEAGETAFFISRKYGISVSDIVKNNPEAADVLSIGMELKIPKVTAAATPVKPVAKEITTTTTTTTPPASSKYIYHIAQPDESADGIARKYGISMEALAQANPGLERTSIISGTKLRIPAKDKTKVVKSEELSDTRFVYHRIKNGENLETISQLYQIPADIIIQTNKLGDKIPPVGYMLKIPHSYQYAVEVATEDQVIYKVKKKDEIEEIAEQYQVPVADIQNANPDVNRWDKLKKNTELTIPTLTVESVDSIVSRLPQDEEKKQLAHYFGNQSLSIGDTINIAFVWPLYFEHNDTINQVMKTDPNSGYRRMVTRSMKKIYPNNPMFREFFLSSLIAINDLKEQGIIAKIRVYDAKKGLSNILKIVQDSTLKDADIIFGPAYPDHAKIMSEYCLENNIRMVLPFVSKFDELEENPYVYQVVPSPGVEYSHIAKETARRYASSNIILVKGSKTDEREIIFSELLKSELYAPDSLLSREISYKEINFNRDRMGGLSSLIDPHKHNLVIIPAEKDKVHTLVVPILDNYITRHKDIEIKLLGFSEWQNFDGRELENLFNVECELYSAFYSEFNTEDTVFMNFINAYKDYYHTEPTTSYPYYGMLGYDITSYFVKGLYQYGNQLENNLDKIDNKGLCVEFDFERVNNWGGFVNKNLYPIEYTKEFDINLIE